MKRDIDNSEDVRLLVDTFYAKVRRDEVIGYIFEEVARVHWDTHLPKIYTFWETILLGTMTYQGNPMVRHIALNNREKLTDVHFDRWLKLWRETVDALFEGERANEAKSRADSIRQLMQFKIAQAGQFRSMVKISTIADGE